jgi:hypothetical protein
MDSGGFWCVAHSFVHSGKDKVTSLTLCVPRDRKENSIQLTFSDKKDPIRVKLGLDEVAGLAKALECGREWKAFHTFEKEGKTMETRIQYGNGFINAERSGNKIALKLTSDELAGLELALKTIFSAMVERRIGGEPAR